MKNTILILLFLTCFVGRGMAEEGLYTDTVDDMIFREASQIECGDSWIITAEGLRTLTQEEAIKVAVAIELLSKTVWTTEMREAICETFIPRRFKSTPPTSGETIK